MGVFASPVKRDLSLVVLDLVRPPVQEDAVLAILGVEKQEDSSRTQRRVRDGLFGVFGENATDYVFR